MAPRNRFILVVLTAMTGVAATLAVAHYWNRHEIDVLTRERDDAIELAGRIAQERNRKLAAMEKSVRNRDEQETDRQAAELIIGEILQKVHWRGLETNDKFKDEVIVKLIRQLGTPEGRYRWEAIRPVANRRDDKGRPKDEFEQELLARFTQSEMGKVEGGNDQSQLFAERVDPARQEYHYYKPIYLSGDCVVCHRIHAGNANLVEGGLLSIIQVRLPRKK